MTIVPIRHKCFNINNSTPDGFFRSDTFSQFRTENMDWKEEIWCRGQRRRLVKLKLSRETWALKQGRNKKNTMHLNLKENEKITVFVTVQSQRNFKSADDWKREHTFKEEINKTIVEVSWWRMTFEFPQQEISYQVTADRRSYQKVKSVIGICYRPTKHWKSNILVCDLKEYVCIRCT